MRNITLLLCFMSIIYTANSQTVGLIRHEAESYDEGYVLFPPFSSRDTYLIDKCGFSIHSWQGTYRPGASAYLLGDGTLLRTGNVMNSNFPAGGQGGNIEKINWEGDIVWSYNISDNTKCQHHDIKELPNGNVLAIVWELKTNTEAVQNGRNPLFTPSVVWSEGIYEIRPTGLNTGDIVWEWHLWDHLIQDFDNTKPNFGVVASNPELLNINFRASATNPDWVHLNSVDYNESLDQIVLCSPFTNEIYIIDHSTTTAQAATHSGGNAGKGGDILYRWGNPMAYNHGTALDEKLFFGHDAHWIKDGLPFANNLMIFNNGTGRQDGNYSTIEIIEPPLNGFNYTNTLPYLPETPVWNYNHGNPHNIYAPIVSGSQQLPNGNVLFCDGPKGDFIEITSTGTEIWKYTNPVNSIGIMDQGEIPDAQNIVFRCIFYPNTYGAFTGRTLTPGSTLENTNSVSASCTLLSNTDIAIKDKVVVYPNPVNDYLHVDCDASLTSAKLTITNSLGQTVYNSILTTNDFNIPFDKYSDGIYYLTINSIKDKIVKKVIVTR